MKKTLFAFVCITLLAVNCFAQPPGLISYQGKIVDTNGVPVTGSHNLQFALYAAASGGTSLWTESHSGVAITGGYFNVLLGATAPIDAITLLDANFELWLEITLDGSETFSRTRLVSSPFALVASRLSGSNATASQLNELVGGGSTTLHSHPGAGGNADTLDGLDSLQFLRSDVADEASGRITFTAGSTGTGVGDGTVYINPSSANVGNTLLGAAVGGSARMLLDVDGNLAIGGRLLAGDTSPDYSKGYNCIGGGIAESTDITNGSDLLVSDSVEIEDDLFVGSVIQAGRATPEAGQAYHSFTYEAYTPKTSMLGNRGDVAIEYDLEVGNDLYVGGSLSWAPSTGYLGFNGANFVELQDGYNFRRYINALYKEPGDTNSQSWMACVNLPNGATVTELAVWYKDTSSYNITVDLVATAYSGGFPGVMATVSSSGTPGFSSGTDTTINIPTINNNSATYYLSFVFPSGNTGDSLQFRHARIRYTTEGP